MKPYFAKYLPVEGEIKDGILILDKDRNKIGRITYPDNADGIYHVDFLDGTSGGCDHFVPVKIFLCSRDIQVGDKYWSEITQSYHICENEEEVEMHKMINEGYSGKRYKVIGEISPEATWVTEEMEFDKEDLFAQGIGHNWADDSPNVGKFKFKVKGPCGRFH